MATPDEGHAVEKAEKDKEPRALGLYEWVAGKGKLKSLVVENGTLRAIIELSNWADVDVEVPDFVSVTGKQLRAYLAILALLVMGAIGCERPPDTGPSAGPPGEPVTYVVNWKGSALVNFSWTQEYGDTPQAVLAAPLTVITGPMQHQQVFASASAMLSAPATLNLSVTGSQGFQLTSTVVGGPGPVSVVLIP